MVQTDKTLHTHEIVEIKHRERERERERVTEIRILILRKESRN